MDPDPIAAIREHVEWLGVSHARWAERELGRDLIDGGESRRAASEAMAAIDALLRELHRVRAAIYDLRFSERYFEVRRHAYRREAVRRRERRAQLPCLFGTCGRVHPTGDDGSGRLSAP